MFKPSPIKTCLTLGTRRRIARVLVSFIRPRVLWSWRNLVLGVTWSRMRDGDIEVWFCLPGLVIMLDIPSESNLDLLFGDPIDAEEGTDGKG